MNKDRGDRGAESTSEISPSTTTAAIYYVCTVNMGGVWLPGDYSLHDMWQHDVEC